MELIVGPFVPAADPAGVEVVERKGLGHPDTICDALAERLSIELSRYYLGRFGTILHHNVDKALLVGGAARPAFGGGEVVAPIEVHLAGRAVTRVGNVEVPVEELAVEHARRWVRGHLRYLRDEHVRVRCHVRPGSLDLRDLYARRQRGGAWLANDTSCGVGHAPRTALEGLVRDLERHLNDRPYLARHPADGEDVKVMGTRVGAAYALTVARAFVARHTPDLPAYLARKAALVDEIAAFAAARVGRAAVVVNAADDDAHGEVYLTVTGTSAESGDDGQVGRGNRVDGLITPCRAMSLEAAAGKNPVAHVGKLYNIAAREIAERLVAEARDVTEARCCLVSAIGRPVTEPLVADVRVAPADPALLTAVRPRAEAVVRDQLAGLAGLWERALRGELEVF